jgi:threonine synthase
VPVGNAGNISAIWKGLTEFHQLGYIKNTAQDDGHTSRWLRTHSAYAIKTNSDKIIPVEHPETVATAIRIGAPVSWKKAVNAIHESKGTAETVTDEEILDAQKILARIEGIFVEPASASSIAGLKKLVKSGVMEKMNGLSALPRGTALKTPIQRLR